MANVHDTVAEVSELGSSYRFGEEIADRFFSWTVVNRNVVTLLYFRNKNTYLIFVCLDILLLDTCFFVVSCLPLRLSCYIFLGLSGLA